MINFELENVKKNLEDQGEVFSIELNGLKEIIAIKNDEITKLLAEIKRQAMDHASDRK
jgi:chaperonin cofactor prefoldin